MNITVVCIGKLKEKYWIDAVAEYAKRLSSYCSLSIQELKETRLYKEGAAEEARVREGEGEEILRHLTSSMYVITLEIGGKKLGSEAFAQKLSALGVEGKSDLAFVIGGSLGLSEAVCRRSDFALSFSDMTFPHQMMRPVLLEQIYRAYKINRGETYHK